MPIFNTDISQGSVVTQLRCGGILNDSESVSERILTRTQQ